MDKSVAFEPGHDSRIPSMADDGLDSGHAEHVVRRGGQGSQQRAPPFAI